MSFISEPLSCSLGIECCGGKDLSLTGESALSKKVVCLPWQLVTAVTVRCIPFTGDLCVYRKVLQILLSGRTQELCTLPPGLVGLRRQRGREELACFTVECVEFHSYRSESLAVLSPLDPYLRSLVDRLLVLRLSQPGEKG